MVKRMNAERDRDLKLRHIANRVRAAALELDQISVAGRQDPGEPDPQLRDLDHSVAVLLDIAKILDHGIQSGRAR